MNETRTVQQRIEVQWDFPVVFTHAIFAPTNPVLAETLNRRGENRRHRAMVFIDGHVPAGREPLRKNYGSWELSADRANASRRALQHYAVDPRLIERVSGFGDTAPLANTAPESDSNERITISLSAQQQSLKRTAAAKAYQAKKAESVTTP